MSPDLFDDALRLGLATVIGALIGLNRDLHGKPAGLRTHALVALGSALIVMVAARLPGVEGHTADAQSRVIQGLVTGIGFLGAGVILHRAEHNKVHGLTTAAGLWTAALLGAGCGAGVYAPVLIARALLALILGVGGKLELRIHAALHPEADHDDGPTDS